MFSHVSCKSQEELAMVAFSFLVVAALSMLASIEAKNMKGKLLNILIVFSFMGWGLGIGWAISFAGPNMAIGAEASAPLAILLGAVGALACLRRNERRAKAVIVTAINV
jgi:apolipoprotein N-acyltransferase